MRPGHTLEASERGSGRVRPQPTHASQGHRGRGGRWPIVSTRSPRPLAPSSPALEGWRVEECGSSLTPKNGEHGFTFYTKERKHVHLLLPVLQGASMADYKQRMVETSHHLLIRRMQWSRSVMLYKNCNRNTKTRPKRASLLTMES